MSGVTVFFRDDDIGELTDATRRVVELLLDEGVPCNYQVVPEHLSEEAVAYLRELRRERPGLIVLNQHGLRHAHEIDGRHTAEEYAGGRPYQDQRASIAEGRAILERMLGDDFGAEVFTPPCHKYDENTVRALDDLGFGVLSAGVQGSAAARAYYLAGRTLRRVSLLGKRVSYHGRRIPSTRMVEVSCAIDVDEARDAQGRKLVKDADELRGELRACLSARPRVLGIVLHHANYTEPARLDTLRALIAAVRAEPGVRLATMESIAAELRA